MRVRFKFLLSMRVYSIDEYVRFKFLNFSQEYKKLKDVFNKSGQKEKILLPVTFPKAQRKEILKKAF